jgi:tripartite-type tricarboxylate transporter receptor subunit TctC
MSVPARLALCAFVLVAAHPTTASAQAWPAKPLRVIVPSQPGGGFDVTGRVLAERMGPLLGTQLLVENRTGAGSVVGTEAVAKAPADGYTLLVGGLSNIALNPALYERLGYAAEDFRPIGLAVSYSYTLIAHKAFPADNLKDLVAYAKANPGKVSYAGAAGTGQHVAASVLLRQNGVEALHVPYKGAQAVYQDLLGGRVDLYFDNTQTARPYIEKGMVKAFATSSPVRHDFLPSVPTIAETGLGRLEMETWFGFFVHRATPQPLVDRLRAEFARTMAIPEVVTRFENGSGRVLRMSPTETEAYVKAEVARWGKLVREAGIRLEQ